MMHNKPKRKTTGRNVRSKSSVKPSCLDGDHKVPDVVDVRLYGGLFQQGRIVDCTEEGLRIDLECHLEPTPLLIPFGEIYHFLPEQFFEKDAISQGRTSVEVLARRRPQEPRTWYPGRLLYGVFEYHVRFGLVEVALPDDVFVVVAPGYRIRRHRTDTVLEKLRLQKGQLVMHTVSLAGRNSAGSTSLQQVVETWNRKSSFAADLFRAVRMDDETLEFITIANDFLPKSLQIDAIVAMHELDILLNKAAKACSIPQRQNKRKVSTADLDSSTQDISAAASVTFNIVILPTEIFQSVFDYLDCVEQCLLRRVCVYWNYVLRLPTLTRVLRVHSKNREQNYLSVASLHYGWTPQTKAIVISGVYLQVNQSAVFCGGQLFRMLVQLGLHSPVERLVLAHVVYSVKDDKQYASWQPGLDFFSQLDRLVEELNKLAAACRCLVLRNIQVHLGSLCEKGLQFAFMLIRIARISGCLTVKQLWSRMDNSLPLLGAAQMQELSVWISLQEPSDILNIVNEGRRCDPRNDVAAENRLRSVNDLDLHRINKFTLHRLVAVMKMKSMTFAVSW